MPATIEQMQEDFGRCSGFETEVIWDLLSASQGHVLKEKLKNLIRDRNDNLQRIVEETRKTIYDRIWEQRKYTNGNSLTSIIYVFVTKENNFNFAKQSTEFTCHPVFRTRKCLKTNDSSGCCMIFIDELGRVYQNWESYKDNNELPPGLLVAPRHGVYTFDSRGCVELEVYNTPSNKVSRTVLNVTDTAVGITGITAACVPIAALMTIPIAAPLLAAASVCAFASAAYSTARTGTHLYDRSQHEQSISITDRHARNNWLSLGTGIFGLGAVGVTKVMTTTALAGKNISLATEVVCTGMNVSSIVLSGAQIANGCLDLILKCKNDEEISKLDTLQMATSLLLFTHSIYNFRLAADVIKDSRDAKKVLFKRMGKKFRNLKKGTSRTLTTGSKSDMIRNVNEIPSDQTDSLSLLIAKSLFRTAQMYIPNKEDLERILSNVLNQESFQASISYLANYYNEKVVCFLLKLVGEFIKTMHQQIINITKAFVPSESILHELIVLYNTKYRNKSLEYLALNKEQIMKDLLYFFGSLRTTSNRNRRTLCTTCGGYYEISNL